MRQSFSGFMQWVHLGALAAFLFPYATFVLVHWFDARFELCSSGKTLPLWEALCRYIWNGGASWEAGWDLNGWFFACFCVALGYNVLRAVLLGKTKKLELARDASGLQVIFSLSGAWGSWYRTAKVWFWIHLGAVAYQCVHFFRQEIPINPTAIS